MKRVEIVWEDVATTPGWHESDAVIPSVLCTQVGYIRCKTENYLELISSYTSDGDIGDITKIPMSLVRRVKRI